MEHVLNQMYHKTIAHWNNAYKGDNSGLNEITHKYDELQDVVCLKPLNGF